jgi:threonine aldolase
LAEDHDNAAILAERLSDIEEIDIDQTTVQTNMVFVAIKRGGAEALKAFLKGKGVLISSGNPVRLVTHLDVTTDDVHTAVDAFKEYF